MVPLPFVGSREWVGLPALGLEPILARVDTGARTSALHATGVRVMGQDVHFEAPLGDQAVEVVAPLQEWRWVRDSGGHPSLRPVIRTRFDVGPCSWVDELTLIDRGSLRHRMLLGRRALAGRFIVDPAASRVWPVPTSVVSIGSQQDPRPPKR